jgi:hypothetical protein
MANPLLSLMMFPQHWDPVAAVLRIRIGAFPFTDPLSPLIAGQPAFADADLAFNARIIPSLAHLPASGDAAAPKALGNPPRPNRRALLEHAAARFSIDTPPAAPPPASPPRVKKYLPTSYRQAFPFHGPQHDLVSTGNEYRCAFESAQKATVPPPALEKRVSWGEVLGHLLRNRLLAEQAGMLFQFDLPLAGEFAAGGWLYAELQPGSPFAGVPGRIALYAARIPSLAAAPRPVFAAIQFPVDAVGASDDARVHVEAEAYADGFAKIVHGAQPIGSGAVDTEANGPAPVRDTGIRLGWDDEQIATWLNRQIGYDPDRRAPPTLRAPLCVLGYRVDARVAKTLKWTSLARVQGDISLDAVPAKGLAALDLGTFRGELAAEAIPLNLTAQSGGDFWLPSHFVSWTGGSIVLADPTGLAIDNQQDVLASQRYTALDANTLPLRYGTDYEFRVRLMDLSSGGPESGDAIGVPGPAPVALVPFRRYVPPRAPLVQRSDGGAAPDPPAQFAVNRPRLGYPDAMFASGNGVVADLLSERDRMLALPKDQRGEVTVPDPDVASVRISVAVRQLALDDPDYLEIYAVERQFPLDPSVSLTVDINYLDVHDATTLSARAAGLVPGDPLPIPTARGVRLSFQSVGKPDPGLKYFGTDQARYSVRSTILTFSAPSSDERDLFHTPLTLSDRIEAIYLRPDSQVTGFALEMLLQQGIKTAPALSVPGRLAQALGLVSDGLTLSPKSGHRTLFGAAAGIRHAFSPGRASITFSAQSDLVLHWIIAVRLTLDRDWTWDGLQPEGVRVFRDGNLVGNVEFPHVVTQNALVGANRSQTELIFLDAIDPKPAPGVFPQELHVSYTVEPQYRTPPDQDTPIPPMKLRLPVTTPPVQTPKLVSAGLAFTPFTHDERYTSTGRRERRLWLEFDQPPADPQDRYYCRVLANSPDPMLMSLADPLPEPSEPELPIDPEEIRVVVPGQPADDLGSDSMQELTASPSPVHFLLPLPQNVDEAALDLFGFYTYELRVGHDKTRWCFAHGRWGPPLRVTDVQHPAPPLVCQVIRAPDRIDVRAPFATPVLGDALLRPRQPNTDMWIMLYAQVLQVDGAAWRNILLTRERAGRIVDEAAHQPPRPERALEFAVCQFLQPAVERVLSDLGLPATSPLSVLAVELIPETKLRTEAQPPRRDPLGESLGDVRILRTSTLVPVPAIC